MTPPLAINDKITNLDADRSASHNQRTILNSSSNSSANEMKSLFSSRGVTELKSESKVSQPGDISPNSSMKRRSSLRI